MHPKWLSVHQWSGRPWFNSRSSHTKDSKKWYLIPPSLTFSIVRHRSLVKWSKPEKGVAPSPTPWCCSNWKGSLRVTLNSGRQCYFTYMVSSIPIKYFSNISIWMIERTLTGTNTHGQNRIREEWQWRWPPQSPELQN